jgi:hypothetical protein
MQESLFDAMEDSNIKTRRFMENQNLSSLSVPK